MSSWIDHPDGAKALFGGVLGFANSEGNVAIFDHVLDLSPHWRIALVVISNDCRISIKLTRQRKQDHPVHHQHRPEDRQVEDGEPGAYESNSNRLGG
jgi:hypothetical protein